MSATQQAIRSTSSVVYLQQMMYQCQARPPLRTRHRFCPAGRQRRRPLHAAARLWKFCSCDTRHERTSTVRGRCVACDRSVVLRSGWLLIQRELLRAVQQCSYRTHTEGCKPPTNPTADNSHPPASVAAAAEGLGPSSRCTKQAVGTPRGNGGSSTSPIVLRWSSFQPPRLETQRCRPTSCILSLAKSWPQRHQINTCQQLEKSNKTRE